MLSIRASLCALSREELESLRLQVAECNMAAREAFYDATIASLYRVALEMTGSKLKTEEVIFAVYQWFWKNAATMQCEDTFCSLWVFTRRLSIAKKSARSPWFSFWNHPISFSAHWIGTGFTRRKRIPESGIVH